MASDIFTSAPAAAARPGHTTKVVDTVNAAGGQAYSKADDLALATLAITTTFGQGFYSSANKQLEDLLKAANGVSDEFLAKTIVYADESAKMKDVVAVLMVVLSLRNPALFKVVFPKVANPKFVRNFVQVVRSKTCGRKSLGSVPKAEVCKWLSTLNERNFLYATIGNDPSLKDVVSLSHFKASPEMNGAFEWLYGKEVSDDKLPPVLANYLRFKNDRENNKCGLEGIPEGIPFQMLTSMKLNINDWKQLGASMTWNQLRQNLNTLQRHGVLGDPAMVKLIAQKMDNREEVLRSKVFPHALMAAFDATATVPREIRDSIQNCVDYSVANVPNFIGKQVLVAVDFSPSMGHAVTGNRGSATSVVTCNDVGSLFAAAIMKNNPSAHLMRFDNHAHNVEVNTRDSIATIRKLLVNCGSGTDVSSPVRLANKNKLNADLVIILSDYESWSHAGQTHRQTALADEWREFKRSNPNAKLVCCDLQAQPVAQAPTNKDVLNVGGFSDSFFKVVEDFVSDKTTEQKNLVDVISEINL